MNVKELFTSMVQRKASHLHLVPGSPILMRINKQLVGMDGPVLTPQDTEAFGNALMGEALQDEFEERLECDFAFSVPGLSRFRVNIYRHRGHVACVVSACPPLPPSLEELAVPELIRQQVAAAPSGLILVCSPRQSGRSSTVAALVDHLLQTRCCQIVSLEEPLEFSYRNQKGAICQREIGADVLGYKEAFAGLGREGADVVVLPRFDDLEIVREGFKLATTGTLVIASALCGSVQTMIENIIDLYPAHLNQHCRYTLAAALRVMTSQVLVGKASGEGLMPAFEILLTTPKLKELIRDNKIAQLTPYMSASAREYGMATQEMALRFLVRKNLVSMDEAMRQSSRPDDFKKIMSLPY